MVKKRLFFGIRIQLLVSHFLAIAVALSTVALLAHHYKEHAFRDDLSALYESGNGDVRAMNGSIIKSFHSINRRGSLYALGLGIFCISTLSCTMAYFITRPVREIEKAVQDFAAGHLNSRVPSSSIPEIHQLGLSINHMAASLQSAETERRDMMGDLAHEMGTPLTVIEGYLEMIQDKQVTLTPEILGQMSEEARRLHRLRDDVLELSKLEAGHLSLVLEKFNPTPILRGLVASFSTLDTIKQGCQIRLDCPASLPDIVADRDRFKQVLINLLSNAINYTPSGTVTIRAWPESKKIWFAVNDTGIGISEADLSHIFERFWRTDESRQLATGGSGIGLALTKGLVERQGGQIEVESELGQGTTFRFWLPSFEPESGSLLQCIMVA